MEKKEYKFIEVDYKLYTVSNDARELEEETNEGEPFSFISGFGSTILGFENNIVSLAEGQNFDFTLTPEEAYGDYYDERVIDLDKQMFCIDGKFDDTNIYEGAVIPLQNADGNRFLGTVVEIGADKVKVDLNHPLAGKSLNFVGTVKTSREATVGEIQALLNRMSGGCGGGCGNCGGGCGGNCGGEDGDCNCGDGGCGGCGSSK